MVTTLFLNNRFNNILFENRNKEYGAYVIRRRYNHQVVMSLLYAAGGLGIFMFCIIHFSPAIEKVVKVVVPAKPVILVAKKLEEEPMKPKPDQGKKAVSAAVKKEETDSKPKKDVVPEVTEKDINKPVEPKKDDPNTDPPKEELGSGNNNPDPGATGGGGTASTYGGGEKNNDIIRTPDKMPEYPGGFNEMMKFIQGNVKTPSGVFEDMIESSVTIYVEFVIDTEGKVVNLELIKGNRLLGKEVVNAMKKMPQWTPGYYNGNPVAVRFVQPVTFRSR